MKTIVGGVLAISDNEKQNYKDAKLSFCSKESIGFSKAGNLLRNNLYFPKMTQPIGNNNIISFIDSEP